VVSTVMDLSRRRFRRTGCSFAQVEMPPLNAGPPAGRLVGQIENVTYESLLENAGSMTSWAIDASVCPSTRM
jgi:hypothetical protein